jgi:hypothetical protein
MIGYYLTSYENWKKIQIKGLIPYETRKKLLAEVITKETGSNKAILVWKNRPKGINLLGCILDRLCQKHSYHIVLIKVTYNSSEVLKTNPATIFLHDGGLCHDDNPNEWIYHTDEPLNVLIKTIPPLQLKLIQEWNLVEMVNSK